MATRNDPSKEAWVTLATNDSYSLGALVLANSLHRVGTTRQKVCLVTADSISGLMMDQLCATFDEVVNVSTMDSGDSVALALLERPDLGITFTKVHCWRLTQYNKCVFLDADTMVVQNSDELFSRRELSAAPDAGWPDCFNSGVFVFEPSEETYRAILEHAQREGSFDGGDQGLLNTFFSDWATKDISTHLPFLYNMVATATYTYLPAFKRFGRDVKIVHFIGKAKPWHATFSSDGEPQTTLQEDRHALEHLKMWWHIFKSDVRSKFPQQAKAEYQEGAMAPPSSEPSHLPQVLLSVQEDVARHNWESGRPDYMGSSSMDNILKKLDSAVSTPQSSQKK